MSAIDVGIGHDDDFVVSQLREVRFFGVFFRTIAVFISLPPYHSEISLTLRLKAFTATSRMKLNSELNRPTAVA